ncbi:MAG: hypothetical protein ACK4UO_08170 [Pseudolabrys sp.]
MTHRFAVGTSVHYSGPFNAAAARGSYKIMRHLPIEDDGKICYRIKSTGEAFERTAEEHQLSHAG